MLANKDLAGFLEPFAGSASRIHAVPVPRHEHHDAAAVIEAAGRLGIAADAAGDVRHALSGINAGAGAAPLVLIGGSLYLAGEALAANGTPPA